MGTFMEYFNAFWVGGLICALCQILLDRTKMLPGRIMVTLVCTGAVLSDCVTAFFKSLPCFSRDVKRNPAFCEKKS